MISSSNNFEQDNLETFQSLVLKTSSNWITKYLQKWVKTARCELRVLSGWRSTCILRSGILGPGWFLLWSNLRDMYYAMAGRKFCVTWRTILFAGLNLDFWFLKMRTFAEASFSGFLPMDFPKAAVGRTIGPIGPVAHVTLEVLFHFLELELFPTKILLFQSVYVYLKKFSFHLFIFASVKAIFSIKVYFVWF